MSLKTFNTALSTRLKYPRIKSFKRNISNLKSHKIHSQSVCDFLPFQILTFERKTQKHTCSSTAAHAHRLDARIWFGFRIRKNVKWGKSQSWINCAKLYDLVDLIINNLFSVLFPRNRLIPFGRLLQMRVQFRKALLEIKIFRREFFLPLKDAQTTVWLFSLAAYPNQ